MQIVLLNLCLVDVYPAVHLPLIFQPEDLVFACSWTDLEWCLAQVQKNVIEQRIFMYVQTTKVVVFSACVGPTTSWCIGRTPRLPGKEFMGQHFFFF